MNTEMRGTSEGVRGRQESVRCDVGVSPSTPPFMASKPEAQVVVKQVPRRALELEHEIDDLDLSDFVTVAAKFGQDTFAYVVTPNADHLLRYRDDAAFRADYHAAGYILMDSRFVARFLRVTRRVSLRVCTGADLTAALLSRVVTPQDRVLFIGGSRTQTERIQERYALHNICHHNPPMGFIKDPRAVKACLDFIEANSPFRFCFLGVGSPQQEAIARMLHDRSVARGLALCVGASLNFVAGSEKRAPLWMQHMSLEWLHRLLQDPGRLAHRYLLRGPRIFGHLMRAKVIVRRFPAATQWTDGTRARVRASR